MGVDSDTLHAVYFWVLFSVYLPLNLAVWGLTVFLFKRILVDGPSLEWKETLSPDSLCAQRKSHSQLNRESRMLALMGAFSACLHHCCHWYTFIKGGRSMKVVWWHNFPLIFLDGIILLIAVGFFSLLLGSVIRLRSIFTDTSFVYILLIPSMTIPFRTLMNPRKHTHTVYEMSQRRYQLYLTLISVHASIELSTLMMPPSQMRWTLWIIYDLMLCLLCCAICWEFCSRLVLLIDAMHQSDEDMLQIPNTPALNDPNTMNEPNLDIPELEPAIANDADHNHKKGNHSHNLSLKRLKFRSASRLRSEHTAEQLQLLQSATKMIVLTLMVCVSVCFWTVGPIALIWRHNIEHKSGKWTILMFEMAANITVNPCTVLYYFLCFHFGNGLYWLLCRHSCHPLVGLCVLPIEDDNEVDRQIRDTLNHQPSEELVS